MPDKDYFVQSRLMQFKKIIIYVCMIKIVKIFLIFNPQVKNDKMC